ncbi:MAG: nucleotidyltransferase domain-containing protein [Parcubacteria group bacterium]|jgi:predicted nucleotidyltransferase
MNTETKSKLRDIFASHPEVKLAYLFGSQVSGEVGPMSDFDFAFYADERDVTKLFDLKFVLMDEIGRLLGTDKIDIVVLNTAENPELKFAIINEGEVIFDSEPYKLIVEPRIMNEYFDFRSMLLRHNLTRT